MKKKHIWTVIIVLGFMMIAGAAGLVLNNALTAQKAEESSNNVLLELDRIVYSAETGSGNNDLQQLPQAGSESSEQPVPADTADKQNDTETSSQMPNGSVNSDGIAAATDETQTEAAQQLVQAASEQTMPAVTIDGHDYIGKLSIPALGLVLPIMREFSYDNLKIAPTWFYGDIETHDLVICAHNYYAHFGRLKNLKTGSSVEFSDLDGTTYRYEVVSVDTIEPTAIDKVVSGTNDLILLTCTTGGNARVIVRCDSID